MENARRRIRDMVRAAVTGEPGVTNRDLLARARKIAPEAVEGMTLQQFHGSFRLPVSRELASSGKRRAKPRLSSTPAPSPQVSIDSKHRQRDAVRDVLRRFAVELSRAESRGEIVRVVARTDAFVEDVLRILEAPAQRVEPAPRRRTRRSTTRGSREQRTAQTSAPEPAAAAEAPDRPPRDMRPRRRPKATLAARAAESAPAAPDDSQPEYASSQDETSQPAEATKSERPEIFTLTHDLEEFRRRRGSEPRIRRPGT